MPAQQASLRITDVYRDRLAALRDAAIRAVGAQWVTSPDFDAAAAQFAAQAAPALAAAQAAGARLSVAYLAAYLRSETGRAVVLPPVDPAAYVGVGRSGKPLVDTLAAVAITMKVAVGAGAQVSDALAQGFYQASRLAASESLGAARAALVDGIRDDDRISGWRRVTNGGCGACLAAATRTYGADEPLLVHDGCKCGAEPIVAGVTDRFRRPDGRDLFARMSRTQQDELLGPDKAELIRTGQAPMSALIEVNPMAAIPDQITEAPLTALT